MTEGRRKKVVIATVVLLVGIQVAVRVVHGFASDESVMPVELLGFLLGTFFLALAAKFAAEYIGDLRRAAVPIGVMVVLGLTIYTLSTVSTIVSSRGRAEQDRRRHVLPEAPAP